MAPPSLPPSLRVRYSAERLLGEGGFGIVVLATDQELGRLVAIKLLRGSLADLESRRRFEQEARLTAAIQHPGLVDVYDLGVEDDGSAWIVYEYVPGQSLGDARRDAGGRFPSERLVPWAQDLGAALDTVHAAGVVHRDIKPANILLREDGTAVLADLGISKSNDGALRTATGIILGTPAFMAPELFRGEPASPASDQFALAASLYLCLRGRSVYGTESVNGILEAVASWRPPDTTGLPGLARALEPDPGRRYASCEAFAAAVAPGGAGGEATEVVGTLAAAPAPGARPAPRRRSVRPLLVAGLALVAVAAGYLGGGRASAPPAVSPDPRTAGPTPPRPAASPEEREAAAEGALLAATRDLARCATLALDEDEPWDLPSTAEADVAWRALEQDCMLRQIRVNLEARHAWHATRAGRWSHLSPNLYVRMGSFAFLVANLKRSVDLSHEALEIASGAARYSGSLDLDEARNRWRPIGTLVEQYLERQLALVDRPEEGERLVAGFLLARELRSPQFSAWLEALMLHLPRTDPRIWQSGFVHRRLVNMIRNEYILGIFDCSQRRAALARFPTMLEASRPGLTASELSRITALLAEARAHLGTFCRPGG